MHLPLATLTLEEVEELQGQLQGYLAKDFMCSSTSPCGVPVLFPQKKGGALRICINSVCLEQDYNKEWVSFAADRSPIPSPIGQIARRADSVRLTSPKGTIRWECAKWTCPTLHFECITEILDLWICLSGCAVCPHNVNAQNEHGVATLHRLVL